MIVFVTRKKNMSGYALSTVESRYQSLAFSRVLGIAVLAAAAAVCGGNAEAQEAVKSPDVYAAMKAGFPDSGWTRKNV